MAGGATRKQTPTEKPSEQPKAESPTQREVVLPDTPADLVQLGVAPPTTTDTPAADEPKLEAPPKPEQPPVVPSTASSEQPVQDQTKAADTVASATGITQTITTQVEPPSEGDVELSEIDETTVVRVREGRCAVHSVRLEYLREGEEFLAGEAYGGVVGAREMARKGILEVVSSGRRQLQETATQ